MSLLPNVRAAGTNNNSTVQSLPTELSFSFLDYVQLYVRVTKILTGNCFPGNLHLWFLHAKNASLKSLLLPCSLPTCCHPPWQCSVPVQHCGRWTAAVTQLTPLPFLVSPQSSKKSQPIVWIPSHLNCTWGSSGSDEGTHTPAVSNTVATSRVASTNTDFFPAPSKITFTSSFLPHVSWAFFLALGNEGQPCNLSKRKPGSVLSPETHKGVTTELLCLPCFWEREYTALLLSAGTEPGSLLRKAVGARTNSFPCGLPVVAYRRVWGEQRLLLPSCLVAQWPLLDWDKNVLQA